MVYNALKMFMDMNPELFDETLQQYKQRKTAYADSFFPYTLDPLMLVSGSSNMQLSDTMIGRKSVRGQCKTPEGICHLVTMRFNESIRHLQLLVMTRISCSYR